MNFRPSTATAAVYFLTMPVSVLERLLTALLAAGLLTSLPEEVGAFVLGLVLMPPIVFPDDPRFSALSVAGVFDPPVPLVVRPLESEPPDAPVEEPPDVCANEGDASSTIQVTRPAAESFI
jgi:hypothetical protein